MYVFFITFNLSPVLYRQIQSKPQIDFNGKILSIEYSSETQLHGYASEARIYRPIAQSTLCAPFMKSVRVLCD